MEAMPGLLRPRPGTSNDPDIRSATVPNVRGSGLRPGLALLLDLVTRLLVGRRSVAFCMTKTRAEKVMAEVCLRWPKSFNGQGYGVRWYKGKLWLAHRAAWDETYGLIPVGMFVCHHCDHPWCVEPTHLFVGDRSDNAQDCLAKGRFAASERSAFAVLSPDIVRQIRARYVKGRHPFQRELAAEYGCSRANISYIVNDHTWMY